MIAGVVFIQEESLSLSKVAAVLVGFVGIILLSRPFDTGLAGATFAGVAWMVAGSLSFGLSFVYARRFLSPLNLGTAALAAYQLGFAILIQLAVTDTAGLTVIAGDTIALWSLVLGIGILGTGGAFVGYYFVVDKLGVVRASSVTFLPPVVALFIGGVLVGEPITAMDYFASALILGAVLMLRQRPVRD